MIQYQKIEFGDLDFTINSYNIKSQGVIEKTTDRRGTNIPVTSITGTSYIEKPQDQREFGIILNLLPFPESTTELSDTQLQANSDKLKRLLTKQGRQLLKLTMANGTIRQQYAEITQAITFEPTGRYNYSVALTFELAYPWFENTTITSVSATGIDDFPYILPVSYAGTANAEEMELRIVTFPNATFDYLKITNTVDGDEVYLHYTASTPADANSWQYSFYTASWFGAYTNLTTGASNSIGQMYIAHSGHSRWMILESGSVNALVLTAGTSFSGSFSFGVYYKDQYV